MEDKERMEIVGKAGREDIATVYIARAQNGQLTEFVESVQPPIPREEKWVLIISTLFGCPVGCRFCDAGAAFKGKLSTEEMLFQVNYLIEKRFPNKRVPVKKFKIQFARMGEPSFNQNVLALLDRLPDTYDAPGLMPSLSTIAPRGTESFFQQLLAIKNRKYKRKFQFQFSLHTTDEKQRDWLMPVKKWSFPEMAEYGQSFYAEGERKITLNFALERNSIVDPDVLLKYFDPNYFLIKITPINPTYKATENKIPYYRLPEKEQIPLIQELEKAGYETILSIGELEENHIGSNCGQYVMAYEKQERSLQESYTYEIISAPAEII